MDTRFMDVEILQMMTFVDDNINGYEIYAWWHFIDDDIYSLWYLWTMTFIFKDIYW